MGLTWIWKKPRYWILLVESDDTVLCVTYVDGIEVLGHLDTYKHLGRYFRGVKSLLITRLVVLGWNSELPADRVSIQPPSQSHPHCFEPGKEKDKNRDDTMECRLERWVCNLKLILRFITLSPSWSCSLFPMTAMNANMCAWHQTIISSSLSLVTLIRWNGVKSRWPHCDTGSIEKLHYVIEMLLINSSTTQSLAY